MVNIGIVYISKRSLWFSVIFKSVNRSWNFISGSVKEVQCLKKKWERDPEGENGWKLLSNKSYQANPYS